MKKQNNFNRAEFIYKNFLVPSFQKSEKLKHKISAFNVILQSQNTHHLEIEKYSEKLLILLEEILYKELRFNRIGFTDQLRQPIYSFPNYCENKYIETLRKSKISDDDSCLSDLENEILRSCQSGRIPINDAKIQKDIFKISKERKEMNSQLPNIQNKIENSQIDLKKIFKKQTEKHLEDLNKDNNNLSYNNFEYFEPSNNFKSHTSISPYYIKDEKCENQKIISLEEFFQRSQQSEMFQPLKALNFEETFHDSRKSSDPLSLIEHDIMIYSKMPNQPLSPSNATTISIFNESFNSKPEDIIENHSLNNIENQQYQFKVPRQYKVNPILESCSNLNAYTKPYIPKMKPKEKLKNFIPFLRDFKPRFLKKENIDKKILRKFRNYLKTIYKTENEIANGDKVFWKDFINTNLLPPMRYIESNKRIEFRSFNSKYLIWLFSKQDCATNYKEFANKYGEIILEEFISAYDLARKNTTTEIGIIDQLSYYIRAIPDIYCRPNRLKNSELDSLSLFSDKSYQTNSQIYSEEQLDSYINSEISLNFTSSTFNLKFDETPNRRCGQKITLDGINSYYEDSEYCYNYTESNLNVSMDSVASN